MGRLLHFTKTCLTLRLYPCIQECNFWYAYSYLIQKYCRLYNFFSYRSIMIKYVKKLKKILNSKTVSRALISYRKACMIPESLKNYIILTLKVIKGYRR